MPVRLTSQKYTTKTLIVTDSAWFALLDLAEEYGWNPYGPVLAGKWDDYDLDQAGYYPGETGYAASKNGKLGKRLVVLDDALNLAEALEQALADYEPLRVPRSFYLFTPEIPDYLPNLGLINAVLEISQAGPFWIET